MAKRNTCDNNFFSSNMRATAKSYEPEASSVIISALEEKEEEDKQEEGWMKPVKCVPIAHFCKKCNKNNEKDTNSNIHDGFGEDNENEKMECRD